MASPFFFKLKYANPRSFQGAHRSTGSFSCFFFFFFILIAFLLSSDRAETLLDSLFLIEDTLC
jgi:hypothetical protein